MSVVETFGYYGGKSSKIKQILPFIPTHHTYAELFFGSGAIFFAKPLAPVNILNDIDKRIYNLFYCLRNHPNEISRAIYYTPYSREEFSQCDLDNCSDRIELARQTIVRLRCGISHSLGVDKDSYSLGISMGKFMGMELIFKKLDPMIKKLRSVQLENLPATTLMDKINKSGKGVEYRDIFIYLDPPYVAETRTNTGQYGCELSTDDHVKLLNKCLESPHKILISGYGNEVYDDLLYQWNQTEFECLTYASASAGKRMKRKEVLWFNYDMPNRLL